MPAERILVVDDSPTQLEATRSLLTHGYEVSQRAPARRRSKLARTAASTWS
jgi:CheY-like chemotaxis protein